MIHPSVGAFVSLSHLLGGSCYVHIYLPLAGEEKYVASPRDILLPTPAVADVWVR